MYALKVLWGLINLTGVKDHSCPRLALSSLTPYFAKRS